MTIQNNFGPGPSGIDAVAMSTQDFVVLCGRILLGWVFVRSGYGKMFDIPGYGVSLAARGVPAFMAYIAVPVEFLGGIAILLGLATRYTALLMAIFTVVATLISHRYWEIADAAARRAQDSNFYKNMAIIGGFALLFAVGAGRVSLDGWMRKKR